MGSEPDSETAETPENPDGPVVVAIPGVVPEDGEEKEIEADDDLEDLLDGDAEIDHELQWYVQSELSLLSLVSTIHVMDLYFSRHLTIHCVGD